MRFKMLINLLNYIVASIMNVPNIFYEVCKYEHYKMQTQCVRIGVLHVKPGKGQTFVRMKRTGMSWPSTALSPATDVKQLHQAQVSFTLS